ncbi:MAG TPA: SpoIIE family protein phosphatase [Coleofasciculaceae cyanobacterium]|jgi:sigma-B regulation protein RsbU (phosphoserine phosphatase)
MALKSSTLWVSNVFGKVPLRTLLVVPFVLQIFTAVGLTGWLSLRNGQKAVNELAAKLSNEATTRIEQHVRTLADIPHLFLQMNAAAIRSGNLNIDDFPNVERYFWNQIQLTNLVPTLYYGDEQGNFILLKKDNPDLVYIRDQSTAPIRNIYRLDRQGNRTKLTQSAQYDPRTRPWYETAVQVGKPTWSPIYLFTASPDLGVTPVLPIYKETGSLRGVLAVDFTLSQISDFLRTVKISPSGQAFIIERSGQIVASSASELPFVSTKEGKERRNAAQSTNLLIQSAADYLQQRFGGFNKIDRNQQLMFDLNGKRQFVQVTVLRDGRGLDWLLVVAIPEADFMGRINENTRTTILLCLAALALATLLGILTARWISTPILRLSEASQGIASGELDQNVEVKGVNELEVLAHCFNQMAQQLRESFAALAKTNRELESRVDQRTAQLKEANEEITLLNDRLKAENLRMRAELEFTRQLQQMILPKQDELQKIPDLEIAGFMEPASEVGGDYYDVLQHNGQVKISIGDVTGHGLESGVLMIMVQTAVRTLLENNELDARKFLNVLNRTIYHNLQRMNSDKNLTLLLLDYQQGQLRLSGQHEEMIIVRGGKVERIDTIDLGFPIGLEADIDDFVAQTQVQLHPGDVVVLYTDGITEAENPQRVHYGIERLCEVVRLYWQHSANQIQQAVIDDVRQHIGKQKVYDDITLLVLKQK